jgi:hypothetical protein
MTTILVEPVRELTPAEEKVRNGATFLDEHDPGWRERINLDEFYFFSSHHCVLGQLYGSFGRGKEILNITWDKAFRFGFDNETFASGQQIQEAWINEIRSGR